MVKQVSKNKIAKQFLLGLIILVTLVGWIGTPRVAASTQTSFINKLGPNALKVSQKYKLYGSVMVAQAIVESGWGKSTLSKTAKNYYGIKGSYKGKSVSMRTAEYSSNGTLYYTNAKFRKYPSIKASMTDNAKTLRHGTAWDANYYAGTWRANAKTYQKATAALSSRYSTNSAYGQQLDRIIATWNLHKRFDKKYAAATYTPYKAYTIMKSSNHKIYSHIVNTRSGITSRSSKTYADQIVAIDMKGTKTSGTKTWYRVKAGTKKGWMTKGAVMHTSPLKANVIAAHNKLFKPAVKTQTKTTDSSSSSTTNAVATSQSATSSQSSNDESRTKETSKTDSSSTSSSQTEASSTATTASETTETEE